MKIKLILNNVEYDHFKVAVPLNSFSTLSEQLPYVIIFTNDEKVTVLSEWYFEKDNLEITDNMTIIKNATLMEAAPRIG